MKSKQTRRDILGTPQLDALGELWVDMDEHEGDEYAVGVESERTFQHPYFVFWIADSRSKKAKKDKSRAIALAQEIVDILNARHKNKRRSK